MSPLDISRYERKYTITEAQALAIRRYVAAFLLPDEHTPAGQELGYGVYSLYLDSSDLALFRQTVDGIKNRYKLRIRFYDFEHESPAFLEIKSRANETIHKQRAVVTKAAVERFLNGLPIVASDLLTPDGRSVRALANFTERCQRLHAQPTTFVCYQREAYVARHANQARVTFDRHIRGHAHAHGEGLTIPETYAFAAPGEVVLELKYTGAMPGWMQGMIRTFALNRVSFPKYIRAARALKLDRTATIGQLRRVQC